MTISEKFEDLVKRRIAELDDPEKPRLRFDRVAVRFLNTVKMRLEQAVPIGKTAMFTIGAPIRSASKTAEALEGKIRTRLARGSDKTDLRELIHENPIRARVVESSNGAPKVIGFVHNPDPGAAEALLGMAQSLLAADPALLHRDSRRPRKE